MPKKRRSRNNKSNQKIDLNKLDHGSKRLRAERLGKEKRVSVSIDRESHMQFKIIAMQNGLTMAEILEHFIEKIGSNNNYYNQILEDVKMVKSTRKIGSIEKISKDNIYEMIKQYKEESED